MSSGWPPEEDDRRWEPARSPSAVGAGHDSRGAERGYSSYAHYGQDGEAQFTGDPQYNGEGQYEQAQYTEASYGDGDEGWYNVPESGYQRPDYRPEPDNAGYGQVSYPDVYDLGAPQQPGRPGVDYVEHPSFPNLPAQQAYSAPVASDYDQGGYPNGYGEPGYGAADYQQPQTHPGQGHPGQAAQPDYGYQDYGDPRYNDPSFGDPAYEDAPYAGYGAPAPAYPEAGYPAETGYGQPGYPEAGYDDPSGYAQAPGYGDTDPGAGYAPGYGMPDPGQAGYVAAEYASGQYPAGVGTLGELPGGMPDPAATGMLEASGMLDASGIADHADLYNYHPGAGAEAEQAFADAPAPMGTLDTSGLPPSALGIPGPADTMIDGHAPVLSPAEAADHAGVLDGGTASTYFAGAPAPSIAETTSATGAGPAFTELGSAEITSLDLPPADTYGLGPVDGANKTGGTGALLRPRSTRPAGKRRGRSGDKRLWFALVGVLAVAAAAIAAIVLVAFPSGPGGPAHKLITPNQLDAFARRPGLEQQMNAPQLEQDVVSMSSGQAKNVVEGVYESGSSSSASTQQIILIIGGNLINTSPVDSVASFTKRFKGAFVTSAGSLGGKAVCVNATASEPGSVAMCAWFDNDTFGEVVSPTMKADQLASTLRQIRPKVEVLAPKKS